MDSVMRAALAGQLGAAINTLREAIKQCPDTLWDDRTDGAPFWQIAYHTLFSLDMYASASLESHIPPAFHVRDAQFLAGDYPWLESPRSIAFPSVVFSKADVLSYLPRCRENCADRLAAMTPQISAERCGFPWYTMSVGELLLLNLRHAQHHAGQLALMLRRDAGISVNWIGSAALHDDTDLQSDPGAASFRS